MLNSNGSCVGFTAHEGKEVSVQKGGGEALNGGKGCSFKIFGFFFRSSKVVLEGFCVKKKKTCR